MYCVRCWKLKKSPLTDTKAAYRQKGIAQSCGTRLFFLIFEQEVFLMAKAVVFFAEGTEECEALLVVDLLRLSLIHI